ncbi:MAG TPA: site-2 protease family protein [Polyangiaceae bacterium]|nr:site-2 protease family protein [Polyangiaceae bacterium]
MHAFRIGKLFGIEIRLDWSWLFIFLLLTWNLTSVFSRWHPDWGSVESAVVAFVASLLFFGCVLVHEFAHSFMARRYDLRVRSITLFLFGGVSNIEHEPPSARAEFFIAVVGPITSILLGIAFLIAATVATALSLANAGTTWSGYAQLGPVETLLAWLGPINLIIGVFNLVPAFPLDGGRVLRSILWGISGNLRKSTRRVSAVGQLFGWMFIVTGIAMTFGLHVVFFGTGFASGLWLAFIGWFLHGAAAHSYKRLAIDDAFAGHTVEEIMRRGCPTVGPELSLADLVHDYLVRSDEHALAVMRAGRLVGLVSLADVRGVPPADWAATPVSQVMRSDASLTIATPDEPVAEAFEQLAQQNIEQLPVLDHGRLVGMLQRRDIARWLELAWGPVTTPRNGDGSARIDSCTGRLP